MKVNKSFRVEETALAEMMRLAQQENRSISNLVDTALKIFISLNPQQRQEILAQWPNIHNVAS